MGMSFREAIEFILNESPSVANKVKNAFRIIHRVVNDFKADYVKGVNLMKSCSRDIGGLLESSKYGKDAAVGGALWFTISNKLRDSYNYLESALERAGFVIDATDSILQEVSGITTEGLSNVFEYVMDDDDESKYKLYDEVVNILKGISHKLNVAYSNTSHRYKTALGGVRKLANDLLRDSGIDDSTKSVIKTILSKVDEIEEWCDYVKNFLTKSGLLVNGVLRDDLWAVAV